MTGWNRTDGTRDRLGWAYARDGASYHERPGADLSTRYRVASHPDRQAVSHYRILTDEPPRYYPPSADGGWEMATVRNGTATLSLDDPADVKTAEGWVDRPEVRFRNESTVSVTVDLETQRLERVSVTERYVIYHPEGHERVDARVHREQSLEYRYGDVDVVGPQAIGPGPLALFWELVYY